MLYGARTIIYLKLVSTATDRFGLKQEVPIIESAVDNASKWPSNTLMKITVCRLIISLNCK